MLACLLLLGLFGRCGLAVAVCWCGWCVFSLVGAVCCVLVCMSLVLVVVLC